MSDFSENLGAHQDRETTGGWPARPRIEFADLDRIPLKFRLHDAAKACLLFVVRWGLAVVLLGVVARLTLTEILVPPIYRLVMQDLAAAKKQSDDALKASGQTVGYLELLIDRGVLPKGQEVGTMPKAEWSQPFVLDKEAPK